jgi:hypothetical protein
MSKQKEESKGVYYNPELKMAGPNATTMMGTTFGNEENGDLYGIVDRTKWGDNFLSSSGSKDKKPMASEIDNPRNVSMGQETSISFKRLFQSQYNLALIFGSVGVEAIVNNIAKVVLNTDDLNNIDQNTAIHNLKQKLDKLASITKDPKTREAFGKASAAIGDIFLIFVEHANEPMMKIGERATKISFHILTIMFSQAMETLEDSLMLIPIFGDGYMIMNNMISMAGSAASIGQGSMKVGNDIFDAYGTISDSISGDESIGEHKSTLKDSLNEIWAAFKQSVDETTELNEQFIGDYGGTVEDIQMQKRLKGEDATGEDDKSDTSVSAGGEVVPEVAQVVSTSGKGAEGAPPKPSESVSAGDEVVPEVAQVVSTSGEGTEGAPPKPSAPSAVVAQNGGNIRNKTFKNKSGGSNNLTRKIRL